MARTPSSRVDRLRLVAAWLLVGLGLTSFAGYVSGSKSLRALGRASMASPLPLAFSDSGTFQGFADGFTAELLTAGGDRLRREGSASVYADLPGPYERHVIYGAALTLSGGWRLPVFDSILRYGFCRRGPLARAMGVEEALREVMLLLPTAAEQTRNRERAATQSRVLIRCSD